MAGSSFFALLDDIASVMDDVAVLSKVAAKKTSGVLGDDLALNAEQVSGISSNRELPVVYAVAKGSLVNKIIIVPSVLLISAFLPFLVIPLLMLGGAYLCFEGVEKVFHKLFEGENESKRHHEKHVQHLLLSEQELLTLEKDKIKGAVRTDFILSAEIIVISLGVVSNFPLMTRSLVLVAIALLMTVGVYGLVALIVKIDDFGFYLQRKNADSTLGKFLLLFSPKLMKFLSVAGTAAMFLVGGGIMVHGIEWLHHMGEHLFSGIQIKGVKILLSSLFEGLVGAVIGAVILLCLQMFKKIKNIKK
jgi:predicted DNA repair protein MutK